MDALASDRLTRAHEAPRDPKDIQCPLLASTNDTSCPLDDSVSHDVTSSLLSQDIPCAQVCRASTSSPLLPSPCTSETHVPPVLTGHFTSPLGTTVNSGFTVSSLSINLEDNSAHSNNHPSCCCDHGRAIIDLRCTVDIIQLEISKLQKQLDQLKLMPPHLSP